MKNHTIEIQNHSEIGGKENSAKFAEFHMAIIEEELTDGRFTKEQQRMILQEMIALCTKTDENPTEAK